MEIELSNGWLLKRLQRQRREGLEQKGQNGLFPWLPICRARVLDRGGVCLVRGWRGKRGGLWRTGNRILIRGIGGHMDYDIMMEEQLKNPNFQNPVWMLRNCD